MLMLNHNLHVFISVAQNGSITATANELYISQPAVSKAIKNLEEELNVKLFHRDKRQGLLLTDAGQEILAQARQMAELENKIYQTAFRINNFIGGKVKIASLPIMTSVILTKVLHRFKTKYPYVTLELLEGNAAEIKKAVEEHRVDFALTSSPYGNLAYETICQDKMIAVSRQELPAVPIDLSEHPERFIFCRSGQEIVLTRLRAQNINLSRSTVVEQSGTVLALAQEDNGIGIISELVTNSTSNTLHRYEVRPAIHMEYALVAHDLSDLTPVAKELRNMIMEFIHEQSQ